MSDWSDLPIIHDEYLPCVGKCGRITLHRRVVYKDEELRSCKTCGTRSTWIPAKGEPGGVKLKEQHRDDPSTQEVDRMRKEGKRRYRKGKRPPKRKK